MIGKNGKIYHMPVYHSMKSKVLDEFINKNVEYFHKDIGCRSFILWGKFVYEEVSIDDAWKLIKIREQKLVELIQSQFEIEYILSSIEMYERRINGKTIPRHEEGQLFNFHEKYVFGVPPDYRPYEVWRVFSERDENLKIDPAKSNIDIFSRILLFIAKYRKEYQDVIQKELENMSLTQKMPDKFDTSWYNYIYDQLIFLGDGILQRYENNITEYPVLLIMITCKFDDNFLQVQRLVEYSMLNVFCDVKNDRTRRRGRNADLSSDSNIMRYILKNCCHFSSRERLGRDSVRLINISKDPQIDDFFAQMVNETPSIIDEIPNYSGMPFSFFANQEFSSSISRSISVSSEKESNTVQCTTEAISSSSKDLSLIKDSYTLRIEKDETNSYLIILRRDGSSVKITLPASTIEIIPKSSQ
jgi:hypothetical protein